MSKRLWTAIDAAGLKAARRSRSHTQADCAAELERLGARASQGTVSRWERGTVTPSPVARSAIAEYRAAVEEEPTGGGNGRLTGDLDADSNVAFDAEFEGLISEMTGSRPWSGRQAFFLDAIIRRIGSGPPLSAHDEAAIRLTMRFLGMAGESDDST